MARVIIVSEKGADAVSRDGKFDVHVRLEDLPGKGRRIVIDRFDYQVRDDSRAHVESVDYPANIQGMKEATEYLQGYDFQVTLAGSVDRR